MICAAYKALVGNDVKLELVGNSIDGVVWLDGRPQPDRATVEAKITELEELEAMRLLRIERDRLLTETDWVVTKAAETGVAESTAWKTYRQQLRDLPSTASPKLDLDELLRFSNVTWPTKPS